jgi:hypothetical protein
MCTLRKLYWSLINRQRLVEYNIIIRLKDYLCSKFCLTFSCCFFKWRWKIAAFLSITPSNIAGTKCVKTIPVQLNMFKYYIGTVLSITLHAHVCHLYIDKLLVCRHASKSIQNSSIF